MKSDYLSIDTQALVYLALPVLLILVLSKLLKLKIEKTIVISTARMIMQLFFLGAILRHIFSLDEWYWILSYLVFMTVVASTTALGKVKNPGKRLQDILLAFFTSSWSVTFMCTFLVLKIGPWYHPQYLIPTLGMVLGNMLNGITLGLEKFIENVERERQSIECQLCFGATRLEASITLIRDAIIWGMRPILNTMAIVGLVSIPGMMTGQLLAGVPPFEAVKYQIMIIVLIATSTTLGTIGVVFLAFFRLFHKDHRLAM